MVDGSTGDKDVLDGEGGRGRDEEEIGGKAGRDGANIKIGLLEDLCRSSRAEKGCRGKIDAQIQVEEAQSREECSARPCNNGCRLRVIIILAQDDSAKRWTGFDGSSTIPVSWCSGIGGGERAEDRV